MNSAATSSAVRPRRSARLRSTGRIAAALPDFPGKCQRIHIPSRNPEFFCDVAGCPGGRQALKSVIERGLDFISACGRSGGRRFDNDGDLALEAAACAALSANLARLAAEYFFVNLS